MISMQQFKRSGITAGMAVALTVMVAFGRAQETKTAADYVPANALVFSTSLKLKEQWEAFLNSKAVKRIHDLEAVQSAWAEAKQSPQYAQFEQAMAEPKVVETIELLKDMGSTESFFYMDSGWLELLDMLAEFQQKNFLATIQGAMMRREPNPAPVLAAVALDHPKFKLPALVAGFKVTNKERFVKLMGFVEESASQLPIPVKLEKKKVGQGEYYSIILDPTLIPDFNDKEKITKEMQEGGIAATVTDALYDWIKGQTVSLTIGTFNDYVIMSLAATSDHLAELGAPDSLGKSPRLNPIRPFLAKPNASGMTYVSLEIAEKNSFKPKQLLAGYNMFLPQVQLFLPPDLVSRISNDVKELVNDLEAGNTVPSEMVSVNLINRGSETYTFTKSIPNTIDFTTPLSVLSRTGTTTPLLAIAGHSVSGKAGYEKLISYVEKLYGYATEFALPLVDGEPKEKIAKAQEVLLPFLAKLNATTKDKFLVATDANQALVVFDTQLRIQKLFQDKSLPKPMPVPEGAVAFTLKDGNLFKEALADYASAIEELLPKLQEFDLDVPVTKIPSPIATKMDSATMYHYPIPPVIDPALLPHVAISDDLLVISVSPSLTKRIFAGKSTVANEVVALDKPAGSAVTLNMAPFWTMANAWYDLAASMEDGPFSNSPEAKPIADAVIDVLGCFKGVTARTYVENGYLVTHAWVHCEDLK